MGLVRRLGAVPADGHSAARSQLIGFISIQHARAVPANALDGLEAPFRPDAPERSVGAKISLRY